MNDLAYIVVAIVLVLGLAPAAIGGLRNARGIFTVYFVAGVLLPGLVAFIVGHGAAGDVVEVASPAGLKALIICLLAFLITIVVSISFEKAIPAQRNLQIFRSDKTLANLFALISISMTIFYIGTMAIRYGGISQLTQRLYQRVVLMDSFANVLSIFAYGSFVFAAFSISFLRKGKILSLNLSVIAMIMCIIESFMLGGRSLVVLLFVALFYTAFVKMKIQRAIFGGAIAAIGFATISFYMVTWRYAAQGGSTVTNQSSALTGLTFIDHVAASIEYVRDRGIDYGQLYINALLLPIPREIWPAKPLQISVELRDYLVGDIAGGNPPGLFGEAYIAFGSLGPLLAAGVLGVLLGWINRMTTIAIQHDCRLRAAVAGILGPLFAFVLVRGGFDIGVLRIGVPAAWCLIGFYLARRRAIFVTTGRAPSGHRTSRANRAPKTLRRPYMATHAADRRGKSR